jgi:hypothetical protein
MRGWEGKREGDRRKPQCCCYLYVIGVAVEASEGVAESVRQPVADSRKEQTPESEPEHVNSAVFDVDVFVLCCGLSNFKNTLRDSHKTS